MDPKRITTLLCEDVRQEAGQKLTVIGVFPGNLINIPHDAPDRVQLQLTFLFILEDGEGEFSGNFRIVGAEGTLGDLIEVAKSTKYRDAGMTLVFNYRPSPLLAPGEYRGELKLAGNTYGLDFRIHRLPGSVH